MDEVNCLFAIVNEYRCSKKRLIMDVNPIIMHKFWSKTKFRNFLTLFKYEPEKYWKTRGKVYYKEKISTYDRPEWRNYESIFLNYIKKLEFETVFEFSNLVRWTKTERV